MYDVIQSQRKQFMHGCIVSQSANAHFVSVLYTHNAKVESGACLPQEKLVFYVLKLLGILT